MSKKVAVLCRGKSLQYINLLPDVDEFVIVNRFGEELNNNSVREKIGDKPVTHILSAAPNETKTMIEGDWYKKINIKEIVMSYIKECVPGGESSYPTLYGNDGIIPVKPSSEKIKPHLWTRENDPRPNWSNKKEFDLPTTGMAGVCHASITMDADEIYICGMDFYEAKYAYGTEMENEYGISQDIIGQKVPYGGGEETEPMKQFLTNNLAEKLPNKRFNIYTFGNFNSYLDNLNVVKLSEEKRKLAVVAGGWHFPNHFYEEMIKQQVPHNWQVDYFCVSHRNPGLSNVFEEKIDLLKENCGDDNNILNQLDRVLYQNPISVEDIENLGWTYIEKPNMMGDFNFLNQWMEDVNYKDYDAIVFTHDDNFIFRDDMFTNGIMEFNWEDWLTIANGADIVPEHTSNLRGSFAILKTELIDMMGGNFSTNNVTVDRSGMTDDPSKSWLMENSVSDWNHIASNFGDFVKNNKLTEKLKRFSNQYRVSPYCFEGERGFCSRGGPDQMPGLFKYMQENFEVE
tara:strand:+ start:4038 stop:5579 length:1542 start_codon:yes stop_codon:yes gene_type:complete